MSDKIKALSLIAESSKSALSADLPRLQAAALAQLARIRHLESEAALRAIVTGIAFHRIKLGVKHGEWEPWLKANVQELGLRQCRYYMKLALVFLAKSRATKIELLALPVDGGDIVDATEESAQRFVKRAQAFVGDLSLSDLLEKHGIKGMTRDTDEGGDDDATSGAAGGEQLMFVEIADHLLSFRSLVLKRENLMQLQPKQLDDLKREFDQTSSEFAALYAEARGQK